MDNKDPVILGLELIKQTVKILKIVWEVAYQLALQFILTSAHDVFHVSILKKFISDASHKIDYKDIEIRALKDT